MKKANINNKEVEALLSDKEFLLSKIKQSAQEVSVAIDERSDDEVIKKCADLLYNTLVGLAYRNISPDMIGEELKTRIGTSGIIEKEKRI